MGEKRWCVCGLPGVRCVSCYVCRVSLECVGVCVRYMGVCSVIGAV